MMWTPDKKIGDQLAFPLPFGTRQYRRFTIAAETPTMWVGACGVKVRKKDGRIIGGEYARSVREMTPDLEAKIVERETQIELQRLMGCVDHADIAVKQEVLRLLGPLFPREQACAS